MIFSGRMVYLTAVTLQEYVESLSEELLRIGLMHFVDLRTIDPEYREKGSGFLERNQAEIRQTALTAKRQRIESMLNIGGFSRPTVGDDEIGKEVPVSGETADSLVDSLDVRINRIREEQRSLQVQINRLEDLSRHMADGDGGRPSDVGGLKKGGTFLDFHSGSIPLGKRDSLEQKIAVFPALLSRAGESGTQGFIVIVAMKRNKAELEKILSDHGFIPGDISSSSIKETSYNLETSLDRLKAEQRELADSVSALVGGKRTELENIWRNLRIQEMQRTIEARFAETKRAVVASGWLPAAKQNEVEKALTRATEGHISLEWHNATEFMEKHTAGDGGKSVHGAAPAGEVPGNIKVPSQLVNPHFLSPFQKLVTNYGIPAYGNVDPTILVTLAYLSMFGLMFGDAGHGLILVLAGLAGRLWSRSRTGRSMKQGSLASSIPYLSKLVLWCGFSAIITGVLFGSYFGLPLIKPVWFNFHGIVAGEAEEGPIRSIFDILRLAIYFGISVIGTGLVINWVNLTRQKRWLSLIFDKAGVLGGTIYAVGVVLASQFAASGFQKMPENPLLVGIIVACALLLFLKMPLEERRGNPLRWLMDWVISLLEIFSGYLANTLSFMRVAGLGIAHVTLMIAFFQIAKMASPNGINIWAVIILIFGNILVIALEGLSAGIQSLRLNYYEFFSKHFQPTGVEYKPISLEEQ